MRWLLAVDLGGRLLRFFGVVVDGRPRRRPVRALVCAFWKIGVGKPRRLRTVRLGGERWRGRPRRSRPFVGRRVLGRPGSPRGSRATVGDRRRRQGALLPREDREQPPAHRGEQAGKSGERQEDEWRLEDEVETARRGHGDWYGRRACAGRRRSIWRRRLGRSRGGAWGRGR